MSNEVKNLNSKSSSFLKKNVLIILYITLNFIVSSCSPTPPEQHLRGRNHASLNNQDSKNDKDNTSIKDLKQKKAPDLIDISSDLEKKIKLAPSGIIKDKNLTFPQLTINLNNADFVKIIRCSASYEFRTQTGEKIKEDYSDFTDSDIDKYKYAWSEAISDNRKCKIVSDYVTTNTYIDLSSPSGSFFYVITPCLSEKNSASKREECSYALKISDRIIDFENVFKGKLLEETIRLSKAQATLEAKTQEVRLLADRLQNAIRACENWWTMEEAKKAWKRGAIMAALLLVIGGIGGAIGGPNMAIMAGQMAMMMGAQVLTEKLDLGPNPQSSCLTGTQGLTGEQNPFGKGAKAKKMREKALVAAMDLEDKFHVSDIFKRIDELTKKSRNQQKQEPDIDDGEIVKAIYEIKKIMQDMNGLDGRVLEADAIISQGSKAAEDKIEQVKAGQTPPAGMPGMPAGQ